MPIKLTYSEVKKIIESKGFTLLTPTYTNSLQKLEIHCSKHGSQFVTLKWLRKGTGCFECGQELKGSQLRHSLDFIKKEISLFGYELLSTEYKSCDLPLLMRCPKHGEFSTSYYTIKSGHGCRTCGYEQVGNKKRTPFEEIAKTVDVPTTCSNAYTEFLTRPG